jgi:hypothetical protein
MTSRERLLAVATGKAVDRKPTIAWPSSDAQADIQVYPANAVVHGDAPALALVPNLYRRFQLMGKDPVALLKDTDGKSAGIVDAAEADARREAQGALEQGAIGVFYEVHGANAGQCTPMEYGGLFLEKDRAFLESVADAPCNFVYIDGKEPYLDFVSDLPAQVFAWDATGSTIPVSEVRKLRQGALAADDAEADIPLQVEGSITDTLEGLLIHA